MTLKIPQWLQNNLDRGDIPSSEPMQDQYQDFDPPLKDGRLGQVFISISERPKQRGRLNKNGTLACGMCKKYSGGEATSCRPDRCPCCGLLCCPIEDSDCRTYEEFGYDGPWEESGLSSFSCSMCGFYFFKNSPSMAKALRFMLADHPDWKETGMHLFQFLEERNRFITGHPGMVISDEMIAALR